MIILSQWCDYPESIAGNVHLFNKKRAGGLVTGIFCLVNCVLKTTAAIVSYVQSHQQQPHKSIAEITNAQKNTSNLKIADPIPIVVTEKNNFANNYAYIEEINNN